MANRFTTCPAATSTKVEPETVFELVEVDRATSSLRLPSTPMAMPSRDPVGACARAVALYQPAFRQCTPYVPRLNIPPPVDLRMV